MHQKILECLQEQFTLIGKKRITGNAALKMILKIVDELTIPKEVEQAMEYIRECEKDRGFMGSPEYYRREKIVDNYFAFIKAKKEKEQEKQTYLKLKEKYGNS